MRHPDWPVRINRYIAEAQRQTFQYGAHDCCTFAAGAVQAMTGVDWMAEFRGRYNSLEEGRALLSEIGAGSLLKTLWKKLGAPVHGAQGRKGDLAWYRGALGVVLGRQAIFLGAEGYALVPISKLNRVFRID